MTKRDPQRTEKLRVAVRYLLERGSLVQGSQSRLAEHFRVSRQRVHQIVVEERRRLADAQRAQPAAQQHRPSLAS
jgi:DNA-directed RNA polymerase sigma subunit (sigma70/sigma32)